MKKSFIIFTLFVLLLANSAFAQIDTTTINKYTVYFFLTSQDSIKEKMALKYVADSTCSIEPHTLMMAGMILYTKGYKDSSMYWMYLGDIRAKFLSSLFKQRSEAALYASLHGIVIQLTQDYAKNNITTLYRKINQAIDYDSLNPLKPLAFLENPNDSTKYIPVEQWKQHYDIVRQAYHHLEQEILQNGNLLFEEKKKDKLNPK